MLRQQERVEDPACLTQRHDGDSGHVAEFLRIQHAEWFTVTHTMPRAIIPMMGTPVSGRTRAARDGMPSSSSKMRQTACYKRRV